MSRSSHGPEPCASANSATSARVSRYCDVGSPECTRRPGSVNTLGSGAERPEWVPSRSANSQQRLRQQTSACLLLWKRPRDSGPSPMRSQRHAEGDAPRPVRPRRRRWRRFALVLGVVVLFAMLVLVVFHRQLALRFIVRPQLAAAARELGLEARVDGIDIDLNGEVTLSGIALEGGTPKTGLTRLVAREIGARVSVATFLRRRIRLRRAAHCARSRRRARSRSLARTPRG